MDKMLHDEEFKNSFKTVDEMIIRLKEFREAFEIDLKGHEIAYYSSEGKEKDYHDKKIDHYTNLIDIYTQKIDLLERTVSIKRNDLCAALVALGDYRKYLESDDRGESEWADRINELYNTISKLV